MIGFGNGHVTMGLVLDGIRASDTPREAMYLVGEQAGEAMVAHWKEQYGVQLLSSGTEQFLAELRDRIAMPDPSEAAKRLALAIGPHETETVEWKTSLSETDAGYRDLCSMINGDVARGTVWFGVGPKGDMAGVEPGNLDKAQRTLAEKAQKFDPPIQAIIRVIGHQDRALISVSAFRARGTPYHTYDRKAQIREGSRTRELKPDELDALSRRRSRDLQSGPWKCDKCGSIAGVLVGMKRTDQGITTSYECDCGGEYWPITDGWGH
jgi:hypothetical protein